MTNRIDIHLDTDPLKQAIARLLEAADDLSPVMLQATGHLEDSATESFQKQQSPDGKTWEPLSETTQQQRKKRGYNSGDAFLILQRGGDLRRSIVSDYDKRSAVVGTNLVYATTQHYGAQKGAFGTGSYKTRTGSFPIPWGDIPARPFLGLHDEHEDLILTDLRNFLSNLWQS